MIKRTVLIIQMLLAVVASTLCAQNLTLKLRNYEQKNEIVSKSGTLKTSDFKRVGDYFIIQFDEMPSDAEIEELKSSGIELMDYIPTYAFLAKKLKSKVSYAAKTGLRVTQLLDYKPEYKIDYRIYKNIIPDWAMPNIGYLKVNVIFFQQQDLTDDLLDKYKIIASRKINDALYEIEIEQSQIVELAKLDNVKDIELIKREKVLYNKDVRTMTRANVLNSEFTVGEGLYGNGVIIGQFDGGEVYEHQDLISNLTVHSTVGYSDHATHVAGTMIGKGLIDPKARGVAPEAQLHNWDFYTDYPAMRTDSAITLEHLNMVTNSWGFAFSPFYCYTPNPYGYYDAEYDKLALIYPKVLQVFATGNDRESCSGGYATSSWNMKNVLFVGAVDNDEELAFFSSCGPLYDGRIVPDVVGMGVNVYSTNLANAYMMMSGTSMSTPGVTASMALLYEAFHKRYGDYPMSSLARALVCNTAKDLGNPGPDYRYGFGRVDINKAVQSLKNGYFFEDKVLGHLSRSNVITVPAGTKTLRVTLAYNDIASSSATTIALVNDLDLQVIDPNGKTVLPLILDPTQPSKTAIQGVDKINNTEQIVIDNPSSGAYTIKVVARGVLGNCYFSVAYDFEQADLQLTYPFKEASWVSGEEQYVRWNSSNETDPINLYFSGDNGAHWTSIATDLDASTRNYKYKVPEHSLSKTSKIKLTQGDQEFISETFVISPVEETMSYTPAYQSALLQWKKVPGATSYNLYKIENGTLNLLSSLADTSYEITDLVTNKNYRYTIEPNNLDAVARRSVAGTLKSIPKVDLAIQRVLNPLSGEILSDNEPISIRIINQGASILPSSTAIPLEYIFNGAEAERDTLTLTADLEPGKSLDFTFTKTAYMSVERFYQFQFRIMHPDDTVLTDNNAFRWNVNYEKSVMDYPYVETFDGVNDLSSILVNIFDHISLGNGWVNDYLNDDFEWWPCYSETYRDGTGPDHDHTSGNGYFLYTESYFLEGKKGSMNLLSPYFNLNDLVKPYASFWYHMYSDSLQMGSLHVDVYSANEDQWYQDVWVKSGSQGNYWLNQTLDLTAFKGKGLIKLRYRVLTSDNEFNAIALDDFSLYENNIYDLKIDSIGFEDATAAHRGEKTVKLYYSNVGARPIAAGQRVKLSYVLNGEKEEESYILSEEFKHGDHTVFEFAKTAEIKDITVRNVMDFEISYLRDNNKSNNKIKNRVIQAYSEPQSVIEVSYYMLGILTFDFKGTYAETSIQNYNTLQANTEVAGYSFYGNQEATVYKGEAYPMRIQPNYNVTMEGVVPLGQYVKAWIDFDQSESFEEDEVVYESDYCGIYYPEIMVDIPTDAVLGQTRMRVRSGYYATDIKGEHSADADYTYGETEDYTLNIQDEPSLNVGIDIFVTCPETKPGLSHQETLSVNLKNFGVDEIAAQSSFELSYSINGVVTTESYSNASALLSGNNLVYDFKHKADLSSRGKYEIKAWVDYAADVDHYNDTVYATVINLSEVSGLNYSSSFEEVNHTGWFATAAKNRSVWQNGELATEMLGGAHHGDNCWATVLGGDYNNDDEALLYSPLFDFSGAEQVALSFWINTYAEPGYDGFIMEASMDGTTWTKIGDTKSGFYTTAYDGAADFGATFWSDYSAGWKKKEIVLNQYRDKKVIFRYRFSSDDSQVYEGVALDDFEVTTSTTTGVEQIRLSEELNVTPKLFTEGVHVNFTQATNHAVLKVYALSGELMRQIDVAQSSQSIYINLSDLASGVYILRCEDDGDLLNCKIVKH